MTSYIFNIFSKLSILTVFIFSFFMIVTAPPVAAISENVLIKSVQLAGSTSNTSDQEYIELYNNSSIDIEVTNWCIQYNSTNLSCITGSDSQSTVYMSAKSSVLIMNPSLEAIIRSMSPGYKADLLFNGIGNKLAVSSGSLRIVNQSGAAVDTLGWSSGIAETESISIPITPGKIIRRASGTDGLIDTDNNKADFQVVDIDLNFSRGGLYESVRVNDLCLNTPETIEEVVPVNFFRDSNGNCLEDTCINIPELQMVLPNGYSKQADACLPIELQITEVLPNVIGSDTGKEFIEIHNPSSLEVNLAGYYLQSNASTKKYVFQEPTKLLPGEYLVISDSVSGFTLPNSTAKIGLYLPDATLLFETPEYSNPKDDHSWALVNGIWQYTLEFTPGFENQVQDVEPETNVISETVAVTTSVQALANCGEGRYRSPETNRCRNIETANTVLTPCEPGEQRNLETNRCRRVTAVTALAACGADQVRNPFTNRCRKMSSSTTDLQTCGAGQERNPQTNRCRKIVSTIEGAALDVAAQPASTGPFKFKVQILGILALALMAYGMYEYRNDIKNAYAGVRAYISRIRPLK